MGSLLLTGREGKIEHYQVCVNEQYSAWTFDGNGDREEFYNTAAERCALLILAGDDPDCLDVANQGKIINPYTSGPNKVCPLEESLVEQFFSRLSMKLALAEKTMATQAN